MRATVTRLMSKGIRSRGMPMIGYLTFEVDEAARRVLVLNSIEQSAIPVMGRLVHPQMADVGKRTFTMHGYETLNGQVFGQAWEIEPERR